MNNTVSIIFSLSLLSIIISVPISFAEDEELGEKAEEAGEAIAIAGEKTGEVIVETGEKAGEVIVETGEKAGEVIVETGEKAGEVIVETGTETSEVIVETGEKAAEKGTIIGEVIVEKSSEGLNEINEKGGGCLIATAAFGSELSPQVQHLREIRDNTIMSTVTGSAFMTGFNQFYYSFSPAIADIERQSPIFQEAVRVFITPMISTLSIMTLVDGGSESEVLGLGITVIILNLGMYVAAPVAMGFVASKHLKFRK